MLSSGGALKKSQKYSLSFQKRKALNECSASKFGLFGPSRLNSATDQIQIETDLSLSITRSLLKPISLSKDYVRFLIPRGL